MLQIPELVIDDEEAKMLANASTNVAKHYNVIVDEKTQAWAHFFVALGAVYGPRIVAANIRRKIHKETTGPMMVDPTHEQGSVVQMPMKGGKLPPGL